MKEKVLQAEQRIDDLKCSIEWIKMRSQYPNAIPVKLGASNEDMLRIAAQENGFEFKKSWSPKANEMYEVWAPKQTQIEQLEDRLWAIEKRLERKNAEI